MNAVMLSIRPKWCALIANGKKTIEIRKSRPKLDTPFKCYIYCTKQGRPLVYGSPVPTYVAESYVQTYGYSKEDADRIFGNLQGKVIGEFVCDKITWIQSRGVKGNYDYCYERLNIFGNDDIEVEIKAIADSCVPKNELNEYAKKSYAIYALSIENCVIYDTPREMGEFGLKRAPQSWCYVERETKNDVD